MGNEVVDKSASRLARTLLRMIAHCFREEEHRDIFEEFKEASKAEMLRLIRDGSNLLPGGDDGFQSTGC